MKQELKRISKVLLACMVFTMSSCENDESSSNTQTAKQDKKIIEAKEWFNDYEGKTENIELVQNLEYNWSEAEITKSEDGTETVIVPIKVAKIFTMKTGNKGSIYTK